MNVREITKHIGLSVGCVVTCVLWLTLDSDLNNALWYAAKMDDHQVMGSVRLEKVALCLGWSLFVLILARYRYRAPTRAMIGLFAGVLIIQVAFGLAVINTFAIPGLYLIARHLVAALAFWLMPIAISAALAYWLVIRLISVRLGEKIVMAVTLSLCVAMIWTGLFDVVHPGIGWR
jgi:hypothetical protein